MSSPTSTSPESNAEQDLRDFLVPALGHATCFARWFGADPAGARSWLDAGLVGLIDQLRAQESERRPLTFWSAVMAQPFPDRSPAQSEDAGREPHPIEQLLSQLDTTARATFLLRIWHDFDEQQLAELLDLRAGQVRVGLMRAFGLMRARLDEGTDSDGDSAQWSRGFRGRLATLTTATLAQTGLHDPSTDVDALIEGLPLPVQIAERNEETASPAADVTFDASASLFPIEQSRDWVPPPLLAARKTSNPLVFRSAAAARAGRTEIARHWPWLFAAMLAGLALGLLVLHPRESAFEPAQNTGVAVAPADEKPSSTLDRPEPEMPKASIDSVIASPDLAMLDDKLNPSQLAVMDQLRWWGQTPDGTSAVAEVRLPPIQANDTDGDLTLGEDDPQFAELPPAERELLESFATLWPRLGPEQHRILRDNARRWMAMSPVRRERAIEQADSLAELAAPMRGRARDAYALWNSMPPLEKHLVLRTYAAFTMLSPDEQRVIAEEFARLSPAEQAEWRFASGDRELLALAGRVFSYVPQAERSATLEMLNAMSDEDHDRLRRGTQRMSAWQREQLRKQLLAESPDRRADLLKRRFGN